MEDPRAAVVLPDFTAAALLHLAGRVELLWDAMALVERAERAWRRKAALPLGWELMEYSPMSLRIGIFG